jgi:LCP family protein required for cell wall assembly
VDFDGFVELVDSVDGVDFDVPVRMKYDDPTQNLHIDLQKGPQHLDGPKAVQFMRFRQNNPGIPGGYPDGDLGRIKAQQAFIKAFARLQQDGTRAGTWI